MESFLRKLLYLLHEDLINCKVYVFEVEKYHEYHVYEQQLIILKIEV